MPRMAFFDAEKFVTFLQNLSRSMNAWKDNAHSMDGRSIVTSCTLLPYGSRGEIFADGAGRGGVPIAIFGANRRARSPSFAKTGSPIAICAAHRGPRSARFFGRKRNTERNTERNTKRNMKWNTKRKTKLETK